MMAGAGEIPAVVVEGIVVVAAVIGMIVDYDHRGVIVVMVAGIAAVVAAVIVAGAEMIARIFMGGRVRVGRLKTAAAVAVAGVMVAERPAGLVTGDREVQIGAR